MNETTAFRKYEKKAHLYSILSILIMAVSLIAVILFGVLGLTLGSVNTFSPLFYGMILGAVVYAGAGLPLSFVARNRFAVIKRYNAYTKVLMRNPHNSVAEISDVCGVKPEVVTGDFDMMVKLGFFEKVSVDMENCKVDYDTGNEERKKFVCPVCGGTNEESEKSEDVCAFCGVIKEKENK